MLNGRVRKSGPGPLVVGKLVEDVGLQEGLKGRIANLHVARADCSA